MVQISMWFIVIKSFLKKAWAWAKKYWQIIFGFSVAVILFIVTRGKVNIAAYLSKAKESYEKEIDVINRSREMEIAAREKAEVNRLASIELAKKKREESLNNLETRKEDTLSNLLSSNSPEEEITEGLSKVTGIKVHK